MSGEKYHASGDCNPEVCRECEWMFALEREAHDGGVCGGFVQCSICREAHDCDKSYEVGCPSCPVIA